MQSKKLETSVMRNRVYEHYRGNRYVVVDIAKDADQGGDEFRVVYRALYDHGQLYVTALDRFTGKNAEGGPRFRLLEIEEENRNPETCLSNDYDVTREYKKFVSCTSFWERYHYRVVKHKPKILIVEDDLNMHPLYTKAFEESGFEVVIFQTADGFFPEDVYNQKPDIISMDLMIGKEGEETERDGFDAIEVLKSDSRTYEIPIIVLSNFYEENRVRRAKETWCG